MRKLCLSNPPPPFTLRMCLALTPAARPSHWTPPAKETYRGEYSTSHASDFSICVYSCSIYSMDRDEIQPHVAFAVGSEHRPRPLLISLHLVSRRAAVVVQGHILVALAAVKQPTP